MKVLTRTNAGEVANLIHFPVEGSIKKRAVLYQYETKTFTTIFIYLYPHNMNVNTDYSILIGFLKEII